jgi:NTP pyrophosphatase (non-canonical NTP hydrolase)
MTGITDQIPWSSTGDEFDDLWDSSPWAQEQPNSIPDILSTMFAQQRKHMQAYTELGHTIDPHFEGQLDNRTTQAAIREFASYTVEELYEAINNLKNKPWKRSDTKTDVDKFKEELADMWHFLIEMHIIAGIDSEEIFRMYFRKTFINVNRQQSGY